MSQSNSRRTTRKTPTARTKATAPPSFAEVYANPEAIIERIELQAELINDPYRLRARELTQKFICEPGGEPDCQEEAILFRQTRGGMALEEAARRCGFILGFEYLRGLIVASAAAPGPREKARKGAR